MFDSIFIFRVIKNGTLNFTRNLWLSSVSTFVMVITLIMLSVLIMLYSVTDYAVKTVKERVDISVYFKRNIDENAINLVRQDLEAMQEVKEINFISAEEVQTQYKLRHATDPNTEEIFDILTDNPFQATFQVKAKSLAQYPIISSTLNQDKYKNIIDKINFEDNRKTIERLGNILDFISIAGFVLAIVFSVISVLVIFNTIALTIFNRREEIEIMKLVGATNWYIRGPFLVESIITSLIATAITGVTFLLVFSRIVPQVVGYINPELLTHNFFQFSGSASLDMLLIPNYWFLLGFQFAAALILTIVSSILAMYRHLKI